MSQVPAPRNRKYTPLTEWLIDRWSRSPDRGESAIAASNLPDPVKQSVKQFIDQSRWQRKPTVALVREMVKFFEEQLGRGTPSETITTHWNEAIPLPAFWRLQEPSLFVIHSLPIDVRELIGNVVSRTRLWRSERIEVARELIVHFQDGLDSGVTPGDLVQSFGDISTTAQLIRRAKRRNRPLAWRMARRTIQAVGTTAAILIVCWLWLLIRFQFAKPNVSFDHIGEIDARSKALAESERAWPLYAEALTKMKWNVFSATSTFVPPLDANGEIGPEWSTLLQPVDVQRIDGREMQRWRPTREGGGPPVGTQDVHREYQLNVDEFFKGLDELGRGLRWPAMVQLVEMNRESIELILQGATKPKFGFIFRDCDHSPWLDDVFGGKSETLDRSTRSSLDRVLLPHIQYARSFEHLLRIEAERAKLSGQHARVVEILVAQLRIATQISGADGFAITKLSALPFAAGSWNVIRQILDEQPDFFTDVELIVLAHGIAANQREMDLDFHPDTKLFVRDLLQRHYSDDGHQNGHLTADGWRLLQQVPNITNSGSQPTPSEYQIQLEGSLMSGVVASRKEMKQVLDHFCELDDEETSHPLWETKLDGPSPSLEFLQQTMSTPTGRIRFYPLKYFESLVNPSVLNSRSLMIEQECAKMRCDSTLVALSLTLYHRRNGSWPTRLEQLCPELLPAVPVDRFDGKPMKYVLTDDKPIVYSVGRNRIDEGGASSQETGLGQECRDGDWRLWPLRQGDR